jgi:hypothetical protein
MARPGRATQLKRGRERAKQEKRKEKLEKRLIRRAEKMSQPRPDGAEDPDIAGIIPGPQPIQE